ncbi:MAG: hypothetical protein NDI61_06475 [Bdellovibrionaceae bacterium]|nr:hypothetical protein [Pseudobdellovibrionaceae bacterium]
MLSIERARFSSVPGEFIGDYQNLSDGRKRELSCALGGALDPRVWPTKVLFDLPPIIHANSLRPSYKLSPDRESLTVLSSLMPRIPGASRPPAPFTLFSWKNGVWLPLSSLSTGSLGVITFQLANDSQNLVVLADPAPHVSEQLFHVARDGRGSPTLLSSPGVILADSPQEDFFVDDRSSSVYYRDSERDPNAQPGDRPRRTLWRASFSGEAPIRLFDLSVNDESYVRTFAVHPNIGKIVFSLIPSTLLNTRSHFTMNVDGTAVTKWPEVTQTNASPTIDRFSSLYPSGRWTERFTTWQTTTGEESQRSTLIDLQTGLGLNVCDQDTNLVGAIVSAPQSIASDWLAISCKNLANTIVSSRLQQMTTGVTFDLPVRGIKFFSQDSLRFWYIQDDAATLSTRNRLMQINLETSVAREVCPQSEGRWLNATSPSSQGEPSLGLHWNTTGQSMDVFQISDDGSCRQVNRVTIPFSYVNFASVKVSPDFTSALVSPDAPGSLSILVFVPLNGTPPLQINSPRNRAAKLLSMDFLGNAGEVVYLSDDAWPGEYAIYTWKKPTTPETVQ